MNTPPRVSPPKIPGVGLKKTGTNHYPQAREPLIVCASYVSKGSRCRLKELATRFELTFDLSFSDQHDQGNKIEHRLFPYHLELVWTSQYWEEIFPMADLVSEIIWADNS